MYSPLKSLFERRLMSMKLLITKVLVLFSKWRLSLPHLKIKQNIWNVYLSFYSYDKSKKKNSQTSEPDVYFRHELNLLKFPKTRSHR